MNTINIKGVEYTVHSGLKAMDAFERETGVDVETAMSTDYKHPKLTKTKLNMHWMYSCLKVVEGFDEKLSFDRFFDACDEDMNIISRIGEMLQQKAQEKKA